MKKKVLRPNRNPDHYSKRGVPYFWAPEWIRGTSADNIYDVEYQTSSMSDEDMVGMIPLADGRLVKPCPNYGRIHAVKKNGNVELFMKAKDGNLSYIQGSIQQEFIRWHTDREIDYLLLGMDPDEIIA